MVHHSRKFPHPLAPLALAWLCLVSPALAAEAPKAKDAWQFEVTPYLWAAGMQGTVAVDGKPQAGLGVQVGFSDILKVFDMGAMATFEARKDRWGFLVDALYFKVADEGTVTGRLGLSSLTATASLSQSMYTFAGTYRVEEGTTTADVLAGLRYAALKVDVAIQVSTPATANRVTETKSWVDPFIGTRIQHHFNARWTFDVYADIGGFGIGSDADLQALVGGSYAFTPGIVAKAGYRYIHTRYEKDDFKYDMDNGGAYLGVGFRW